MSYIIVEVQVKDGGLDKRDGHRDANKWMNLFHWS